MPIIISTKNPLGRNRSINGRIRNVFEMLRARLNSANESSSTAAASSSGTTGRPRKSSSDAKSNAMTSSLKKGDKSATKKVSSKTTASAAKAKTGSLPTVPRINLNLVDSDNSIKPLTKYEF
jgi:hypothetical protein